MIFPGTNTKVFQSKILGGIFIVCLAVLVPATSLAQQYYDPGLLRKTIDRKPVEFESVGIRWGSFMLKPGAELAYENNDNIFFLEETKISDSILHVRPWANLTSDWNRHALNLHFVADLGRYSDVDSQDYDDWAASIDGRIDVRRRSNLNYRATYLQLHEDRSTPDSYGSFLPVEFTVGDASVDYQHTFNRLTAGLGFGRVETDYENGVTIDGIILDNQDRDRTRDVIDLKLSYELEGRRKAFLNVIGNTIDYDQQYDSLGYERSSDGYNLRAGASWDKTGVLVGNLYLEYINQEYDDSRFSKVDGIGLGAALDWTPTQLTNVNFRFRNGPQETTLEGASGYFSSLYSVRLQHELRRNWLANVRFSYTDNRYENSIKDDTTLDDTQVTRAGVGFSYLFNRNFYLSGGYIYEKQSANVALFEYNVNRWFVTFGAEL